MMTFTYCHQGRKADTTVRGEGFKTRFRTVFKREVPDLQK
jgi:hypothetical protein